MVKIIDGSISLDDLSDAEKRFIKLGRLKDGYRLACQTAVSGDVSLEVPDLYKLPHVNYSE